mgnify:CR=1 FL=1
MVSTKTLMTFFGVVCLLPLPAVASLRDTKANCGGTAVANSVGRLIEMNSSPANRRIHAFDAMGRVIRSRHVVNGTGGGAFKFTNYSCDLAGNLTSMTYPSGRVVATEHDLAGRVLKGKDAGTQARYGEVGFYAEHGSIGILKLGQVAGGGEALTETWTYNNRLQPKDTIARAAGSGSNVLKLEYL